MSLTVYRRKRKFDQTPEPKADKKPKKSKALRFVVQKHAATRTHYDFRLELDGALLSWAVPKGPTLTSGDPRLAVHVEDHPIDYGDFEGVIPKGNYGAGTVMVWDAGTYVERGSTARADSEKAMRAGMEKGHVTFVLEGEKLRGEFALVKIKKKGAPPNGWLLIKKHDAEASRQDVTKQDRSCVTGRSMEEIAKAADSVWIPGKGRAKQAPKRAPLKKPPRPAPKKAPVKAALPHRVRPMEPVFAPTAPTGGDWIFETFGAGPRALAEVEAGQVRLHSRSLLPFEKKYPAIVSALRKLGTTVVLDGEIVGSNYLISDVLYIDGKDLRETALSERKKRLESLALKAPLQLAELFEKPPEAATYVAKKSDSTYRSGLSRDWLRIKGGGTKGRPEPKTSEYPPLTHPNKVFWPKEKITKGDLAEYYKSVADVMLPYMKDRPQSLHRQPDGLKNEGFFHKDMSGFLPRRMETVRIWSGSSDRTLNYVLCQDKWALLYLVNLGCIEFNPWLSKRPKLENPDQVVIDLDPDDNSYDEVVEVALEVRRVLTSIGAESFCKTSGASGMHIVIPTGAKFDFDTGRLFAEAVCNVVQKKFPKNTSVERTPAKRRHKIYLDFLQNRRGQTLAAPYCVRPRPNATVSAPLKWSEVKKGLTPEAFTIETMARRIERVGDLWKGTLNTAVDIEACHKRLRKNFHI